MPLTEIVMQRKLTTLRNLLLVLVSTAGAAFGALLLPGLSLSVLPGVLDLTAIAAAAELLGTGLFAERTPVRPREAPQPPACHCRWRGPAPGSRRSPTTSRSRRRTGVPSDRAGATSPRGARPRWCAPARTEGSRDAERGWIRVVRGPFASGPGSRSATCRACDGAGTSAGSSCRRSPGSCYALKTCFFASTWSR